MSLCTGDALRGLAALLEKASLNPHEKTVSATPSMYILCTSFSFSFQALIMSALDWT